MEGGIADPYEEQLLAVFNSCLEEGDDKLGSNGLRVLCDKLQLDEDQSGELITCLEERKETFIDFETFRDGLLKLLGQGSHDSIAKDVDDISDQAAGVALDGYRLQVTRGQRLKVAAGKINGTMNGVLDRSEIRGSSAIGYSQSAPKEWLEQMFEKLDIDCDGLISFDEFIMVFENEKNTHEQLTLDWTNGSSGDVVKSRDGEIVVNILGPHQTGYARIGTIVAMWEVAGVLDPATLLSDLGFTSSEIRLTDLTTVLCDELKNLRDEPDNAITPIHMNLLKGALTLYQEEVRCMITLVEHLSGERDKLRIDVAEANERANLLAQEIDEHHVRLEKSRQDQLKQLEHRHAEITKDLSIQCTSEREAHTEALKALDRQLQVVQQEEQQVRTKLANVLHDNQALETEVENLTEQVSKLKFSNKELLLQMQHLAAEHEEIDTSDETGDSEQIILLVERIKNLQSSMAVLRDENDEMTAELEFMKIRSCETSSSNVEIESSKKFSEQARKIVEFIREAANAWSRTVTIENDDTEISEFGNVVGSIVRELRSLIDTKNQSSTVDYRVFTNFIGDVITGLETNFPHVAFAKNSSESEKTKIAEQVSDRVNDLEIECEERASESLRDLVVGQLENLKIVKRSLSQTDDMTNNIDKNFNNLDGKSGTKNKITSLRDYPPRKDEISTSEIVRTMEKDKNNLAMNVTQTLRSDDDDNSRDSLSAILHDLEAKLTMEKKQLTDRCVELERSLDLLRTEYEQCEDYWAAKLEEERQLFEQEQKISDDKFTDLIAKMAEYEEQFGSGEKSRNDGRLSPIEEKYYLEQQYADLEEECESLKSQFVEFKTRKETEIEELRDRLLSNAKKSSNSVTSVSTQFPLDGTPLECISTSVSQSPTTTTTTTNNTEATATMVHTAISKKIINHTTSNHHRTFDSSKLNQISETAISNDPGYPNSTGKRRECYCQQIEAYTSMEELCRVHKTELNRLYQKKLEIDNECVNLSKQKENLMRGVTELKNVTSVNRMCSEVGDGDDVARRMTEISLLKALSDRFQLQEKKRKNLKISLTHQQQYAERMLQQTWQQHCQEVAALRYALQKTEEKLKLQVQANQEQADRLAKADILSTDLYVQNAHLIASVKRLELHCLALTQFTAESTSI